MATWFQRMGALFTGQTAEPSKAARAAWGDVPQPLFAPPGLQPGPIADPPAEASQPAPADPRRDGTGKSADTPPHYTLFEWLVDAGPTVDEALFPDERRLLARLDTVLATPSLQADLLPRSAAVIPQLMRSLRDEGQSAHALASRIEKDPNLVGEVIRMANAATARSRDPVSDLPEAIGRLGTAGLHRAIARVVVKPIFDLKADSLAGRSAARLWLHSEAKAAACMGLGVKTGIDLFDGYLAGLMHDIGWTAALRSIDREGGKTPTQFSRAFIDAMQPRRDRFFAALIAPWQLTDAISALAVELKEASLSVASSALAQTLFSADRTASLDMLGIRTISTEVAVAA